MSRALILGGSGPIGRAVAARLSSEGWTVTVTGRDPGRFPGALAQVGVAFRRSDRFDAAQLAAVVGSGADLVVDCACYSRGHAGLLLPLLTDVGNSIMISSKAVYVDSGGNHVNSDERPRFNGPIREDQPTMAPGDGDFDSHEGYGANKVAAERALLDSKHPVTVLRASKVHGVGASPARERALVERALDGRRTLVLRNRGDGVDHPTAAVNLAALVSTVADRPGTRILNAADPDAPSAREIARIVATHFGHEWREVLLEPDDPRAVADPALGRTPWDAHPPIVLDTAAAEALGYRAVGDYATTVASELDWLAATARAESDDQASNGDALSRRLLDYQAEDRILTVA
jgi:nucleoside-diphosphate-sugar epimerase